MARETERGTSVPRGARLEADVKRIARSGELRLGVWTAPRVHEPRLLADRAAVEWELIPLGARWTQIDRAAGEARIVHWLRTNLAYPKSAAQMDAETAAGFAAQLFALVGSGAPLPVLANDPWDPEEAGSSKSVSIGGFTFDGALAVVAAGEPARVGLLWIGVED